MALYVLLRVQLQVERRCELPNVRNWYLADNATAPALSAIGVTADNAVRPPNARY